MSAFKAEAYEVPVSDENVACPLCGSEKATVIGEKGRFQMDVRSLCCNSCATIYVSPRPTEAAMAEYYRTHYRKHYGTVAYLRSDGSHVGPGEPGFAEEMEVWHQTQAAVAQRLLGVLAGAKVLEVGCRHARTLQLMREKVGIEPHGIEPGEDEAAQARSHGVACFTGTLADYAREQASKGAQGLDAVQMFHVFEHLHQPLESLLYVYQILKPGGRLLLEVPNAYRPTGLLEDNYFQNVHLVTFSRNSLPALLRRARFEVHSVLDLETLYVVATKPSEPALTSEEALVPLPFSASLLDHPEENAEWLTSRLQNYTNLERCSLLLKHRGYSENLYHAVIQSLQWPAFPQHLADVCAAFSETMVQEGRHRELLMLLLAVANGPFDPELRQQFQVFAENLMGRVIDAA